MAASSSTHCINLLANSNKITSCISHNQCLATANFQINEGPSSSFLRRRSNLQISATRTRRSSKTDFVVRNASPEVAGDVISSTLSMPAGIPGLSLLGDNPWLTGAAGLFVTLPLLVQRILSLTKQVDMAAQTVEKIADAVEKVAEEVDKAAENMKESLPEGELKKMVGFVEHMAEEVAEDAQKVEDLMDKVEELDDKLEDFLHKQFKDTGKA